MANELFDQWAIVELFGHQRIAGHVSEQVVAGQGFVRVDVPAAPNRDGFTRLFGTGAIYSIIPTTEAIATAFAGQIVEAPIKQWELRMLTDPQDDPDEEPEDFESSLSSQEPY